MGPSITHTKNNLENADNEYSNRQFAEYAFSLLHSLQRIANTKGEAELSRSLERAKQECRFISEPG